MLVIVSKLNGRCITMCGVSVHVYGHDIMIYSFIILQLPHEVVELLCPKVLAHACVRSKAKCATVVVLIIRNRIRNHIYELLDIGFSVPILQPKLDVFSVNLFLNICFFESIVVVICDFAIVRKSVGFADGGVMFGNIAEPLRAIGSDDLQVPTFRV